MSFTFSASSSSYGRGEHAPGGRARGYVCTVQRQTSFLGGTAMAKRTTGMNDTSAQTGNTDDGGEHDWGYGTNHGSPADDVGCRVQQLPTRLLLRAAEVAAKINPVNA